MPAHLLETCVFATVLLGFFGLVLKRNLMMKIISMDVMSTGVIATYVLVAARGGCLRRSPPRAVGPMPTRCPRPSF
jgi:multicomponent Na+:H+ antiporter subunit C